MGMDPATIAWLAGTVGGKAIESFGAQNPYQQRTSFRGTGADPVTMLSEVHNALSGLMPGAAARANAPVTLPDATVGDLPSFAGGNLPGPIGVTSLDDSGHSGLKSPLTLPGLNLDLSKFGGGGSGGNFDYPYPRAVDPKEGAGSVTGDTGQGAGQGGTPDSPGGGRPAKSYALGPTALPDLPTDAAPTRRTPTMLPGEGAAPQQTADMGNPMDAGMGAAPQMPGMPDMSHLDARTQGALQLLLHAAGGAV